jgi:hypothetical protein
MIAPLSAYRKGLLAAASVGAAAPEIALFRDGSCSIAP